MDVVGIPECSVASDEEKSNVCCPSEAFPLLLRLTMHAAMIKAARWCQFRTCASHDILMDSRSHTSYISRYCFWRTSTHTDTSEALQKAPLSLLTACQGGTTLQIMAMASSQPFRGVHCIPELCAIAQTAFTWCPDHCSDL